MHRGRGRSSSRKSDRSGAGLADQPGDSSPSRDVLAHDDQPYGITEPVIGSMAGDMVSATP